VLTLIVILSVMNGFQMGYIESILEVSSYHIRVNSSENTSDTAIPGELQARLGAHPEVISVTPFLEAQTLMTGSNGRQQGVLLRAVPENIREIDPGFAKSVHLVSGQFSLEKENAIVLGSELARALGVRTGGEVNLLAVSGGGDTELFSSDRRYRVSGIIKTGYYEIDASFAFVSLERGQVLFGENLPYIYGMKLKNTNTDQSVIAQLHRDFPDLKAESWRSYNRAFFGALRVEKNVLMFLVFLIFVVVGVNIFNSMRRQVYERREEISVLSALGGRERSIQLIFIMNGFLIGCIGSAGGLLLGLLISVQINEIFSLVEVVINGVLSFISLLLSEQEEAGISLYSPLYFYLTEIPSRVILSEVVWICIFGIVSSVAAAWAASRRILGLSPAEVLRDE
jgi:lipoprotein-releasing system permease protein